MALHVPQPDAIDVRCIGQQSLRREVEPIFQTRHDIGGMLLLVLGILMLLPPSVIAWIGKARRMAFETSRRKSVSV